MTFKSLSVFYYFVIFLLIILISVPNTESNVIGNRIITTKRKFVILGNSCRTKTNGPGTCIPLNRCVISDEDNMFELIDLNECSASTLRKIICCPDNGLQAFYHKPDERFKNQPQIQRAPFHQYAKQVNMRTVNNLRRRKIRSIGQTSNTLTEEEWNTYLENIKSGKITYQGQKIYLNCDAYNPFADENTLDLTINFDLECRKEQPITLKNRLLDEPDSTVQSIDLTSKTLTEQEWNTYLEDIKSGRTTYQGQKIYVDCDSYNPFAGENTLNLTENMDLDCRKGPITTQTRLLDVPGASIERPFRLTLDIQASRYTSESEEDTIYNTDQNLPSNSNIPVLPMISSTTTERTESDEDLTIYDERIDKYMNQHLSVTEFHKFMKELSLYIEPRSLSSGDTISVSIDCDEVFFFESQIKMLEIHRVNYTCEKQNSSDQETSSAELKIDSRQTNTRKAVAACNEWKDLFKNKLRRYILYGRDAELGEFPHIVAIGYINNGSDQYSFECGGTLISNNYVVTAAHCVKRKIPKILRMGIIILSSYVPVPVDRNIKNIIIHPNYTTSVKYHDIALLELENPVNFTSLVAPACLDAKESHLEDDTLVTLAGWGEMENRRKATILQKTNVSIVLHSDCNTSYGLNGYTTSGIPEGLNGGQMCAIDRSDRTDKTDSCQGDSGGPLILANDTGSVQTLYGIVSFGSYCGTILPSVYVKVSYYLDWIEPYVWP